MRRDMDEDINWGSLFFKVLLVFIVIILIIWLFSKFILNKSNENANTTFSDNLNKMYKVAEKYYEDESRLPSNGNAKTLTLKEMISNNLISTLKDGKTVCSTKSSYAKVTNKDGEYTLKVILTCGANSDYISKVIKKVEYSNDKKEESSNTSGDSNTNNSSNNESNNNSSVSETNNQVNSNYDKEVYYKFCKIGYNSYYTTTYIDSSKVSKGYKYSYTVKLDNINNASDISINDDKYFLYKEYYDNYMSNEDSNFTVTSGNSAKEIVGEIKNVYNYVMSSLKVSNFDYTLSDIYNKDGSYYVDISITINSAVKRSYSYNNSNIYFVPVYFSISYADMNNCASDTSSNSYKYSSYYVVR